MAKYRETVNNFIKQLLEPSLTYAMKDIAEVEAQLEQNYKMLRRLITKLGRIH